MYKKTIFRALVMARFGPQANGLLIFGQAGPIYWRQIRAERPSRAPEKPARATALRKPNLTTNDTHTQIFTKHANLVSSSPLSYFIE